MHRLKTSESARALAQMAERILSSLDECAKLVAEAVTRGDFERARELIDVAARIKAGGNKT